MEVRFDSETVLLAELRKPLTASGKRFGISSFGHEKYPVTWKAARGKQILNLCYILWFAYDKLEPRLYPISREHLMPRDESEWFSAQGCCERKVFTRDPECRKEDWLDDRKEEPLEVKSKEGATIQRGIEQAIRRVRVIPDIIYDLGDFGKGPPVKVYGRDAVEVQTRL